MTTELTELKQASERLRNAIDANEDPVSDAAERLLEASEEAQEVVLGERKDRESAARHLETRYPRLFSGDLSKLDWSERKDLFEALVNIDLSDSRATDSERTLARIDGKLR